MFCTFFTGKISKVSFLRYKASDYSNSVFHCPFILRSIGSCKVCFYLELLAQQIVQGKAHIIIKSKGMNLNWKKADTSLNGVQHLQRSFIWQFDQPCK